MTQIGHGFNHFVESTNISSEAILNDSRVAAMLEFLLDLVECNVDLVTRI